MWTRGRFTGLSLLGALLMVMTTAMAMDARADASFRRTLERVVKLLPKKPAQVVLVDLDHVGDDLRTTLAKVEAFVVQGQDIVYVLKQSGIFRRAMEGWPLHDYILAAIIWHEMAHLDGADELDAQLREEALWKAFVMADRVERSEGLRYLAELEGRRRGGVQKRGELSITSVRGPLPPGAIVTRVGSKASRTQ